MLRTRLAARLYEAGAVLLGLDELQAVCAATELTHTASLCHDDVVDNALMRRSMPTLWQSAGPTGAILVGDLLLCEAMDIMIAVRQGQFLPPYIAKVREVIAAEAEHEFLWRGRQPDETTSLRLARGKTGALFAFVARCCGGDNVALAEALTEAGYRVGTAYQLADDLLDVIGNDVTAGKTLGTDQQRDKATLPLNGEGGEHVTTRQIGQLCLSAGELLADFPEAKAGLRAFLLNDLQPVVNRHLASSMELTV
jgi:geranylgeranyl pyrophosphate synthase